MSRLPVCDVVIVNWNTGTLLQECINSLAKLRNTRVKIGAVVVIDNASTDGSFEISPSDRIQPIICRNDENIGFGRACNLGAKRCSGDFILFLNPDTRLMRNTLDSTFDWLASHSKYMRAILGVQLINTAGEITTTCSRFPSAANVAVKSVGLEHVVARWGLSQPMFEFDHLYSRLVDQVMGAFFLVPRALFLELDGFQEKYFLYYEEVDFCRRARESGYQTVFCAAANAVHVGGGSSASIPARRLFLNLQSRLIYYREHFSQVGALVAITSTLVIEPVMRLIAAVASLQFSKMANTIRAYWWLCRRAK